jgi:adenine-specific DNA methylase
MTTDTESERSQNSSLLEEAAFPFEYLSDIAEMESWRKEVFRPIYHIHKWWAQRLGSVFRAILIASFSSDPDLLSNFYRKTRLQGIVFDPFMGSGTTVGEALKLGLRAIGRDINPVSHLIVSAALGRHSRAEVEAEFEAIERDVAAEIHCYYKSIGPDGTSAPVLYYFWVKVVACPRCHIDVDLFSSYLFVRNAYVKRKPACRVVCPDCGDVSTVDYGQNSYTCPACSHAFNPLVGPAQRATAQCRACRAEFTIAMAIKREGGPPRHRMYAKSVLAVDGSKTYLPTTEEDQQLYAAAADELKKRATAYPLVPLTDGYNTRQVLNYNYQYWHQMFNERQLLCLSILADRIAAIEGRALRELFAVLFSGVLEFNNMFASFKGEGTGAVRHMFAHHILKPERMPLEANPWGTPRSSGAFSTLFYSRIVRALEYANDPFEVATNGRGRKVFGLSAPLGQEIARTFAEFVTDKHQLYLSCGDSSVTDLDDRSVDAVVTDPPFFDNVHYSELADFFHVWQRHMLDQGRAMPMTTRQGGEVQSADPDVFAHRLEAVFRECYRILKDDGPLVFTYHHSRQHGWNAVLKAIIGAGFQVAAVQPMKSEMSVATPKSQASRPIDVDMIIVCRKRGGSEAARSVDQTVLPKSIDAARAQVLRFVKAGRQLGYADIRVIVAAHVVRLLSKLSSSADASTILVSIEADLDSAVERLRRETDAVGIDRVGQLSFTGLETPASR